MSDWQDDAIASAQVRDDDDIPDDWENEPEEKVCSLTIISDNILLFFLAEEIGR